MFKRAKKMIMAGFMATLTIIPGIAGASAPILSPIGDDYIPENPPAAQYYPRPGILGNYIKGDRTAIGDVLGLGRGQYEVVPLSTSMLMESTAYSPHETSGYTATGERVRRGIAAVDPDIIPLGTKLYVDGYGEAVAADTGGAIRGNRIDLGFDNYQEAINWGRRGVMVQAI